MKAVNLALYIAVGFVAMFVLWFVFDQFPWVSLPIGDLRTVLAQHEASDKFSSMSVAILIEGRAGLFFALDAFMYMQHLFVYLVSSALGLAIMHSCEKAIFPVRAEKVWNWKILGALLILPVLFFSSSLFDKTRGGWYEFATVTGASVIGLVWLYCFLYHLTRESKVRSATKLAT